MKRFLDQKQNRQDKFFTTTTGWTHVKRIIEVISMSIKDLIDKIVPTTVTTKILRSKAGKKLNKESEYLLREDKKYIPVGKKMSIEYVYSLDLKGGEDT
jgi:hypothetical protein